MKRMISWSREPAGEAGDHPERGADDQVERHGPESDDQRDPRAVDDAGEDVATGQVGAEEVARAGRLADRAVIGLERIERDEQRAGRPRSPRWSSRITTPDDREAVAQEPPDGDAAARLSCCAGHDLARQRRQRPRTYRILGSATE